MQRGTKPRGERARALGALLAAALALGPMRQARCAPPDPGERPAGIDRGGEIRVVPLELARRRAVGGAPALHEGQYVPECCVRRLRPLPLGARRVLGLPVDLNDLSASEFEELPGIGPALAGRIIDTRRRRGGFREAEELLEVPGIGPVKLEAIRRALHRDGF
jgi:competence ComEA-like helix-hairpin-helix protein